jgi:DNA-binding GntR family transcriptional regulator
MPLPTLKAMSVRQSAEELLRCALREGRYRPGDDLSEGVMASEMEVSRGPVREALLVLAAEGLVSHTQNRGFSVPRFTIDDSTEINQVRLALETTALELARQRISANGLARLEELKNRLVNLFRDARTGARDGAEIEFHCAVSELTGNDWLVESLKRVIIPYFTFLGALHIQRSDLTLELFTEQHERYLDYLNGRSTATAAECVSFHLGILATQQRSDSVIGNS